MEVTLDEQTALRIRRLFELDAVISLSRSYDNTCAPNAPETTIVIETPNRKQRIRLKGYLPPALDILWHRITDHFQPEDRPQIASVLTRCTTRQQAGSRAALPPGLSPDACVTEEVGIVHDPVEEVSLGKPALFYVLAPKGWKVTLHVQTEGLRYYRQIPMTCNGCICKADVPQEILSEGTLYYYITAQDRSGKQVDGAASRQSPNLVDVKSCLKFD